MSEYKWKHSLCELWDNIKWSNLSINGVSKEGSRNIFDKVMVKYFSNFKEIIDSQPHEAQ